MMVNFFNRLASTPKVTFYINEDDIENAPEISSTPAVDEFAVPEDSIVVPLSDNYFPNTAISAPPSDVVDSTSEAVNEAPVPPDMPSEIAQMRMGGEASNQDRLATAAMAPELARMYLGKNSLDRLEQNVVDQSPIVEQPTESQPSLGFNWRKVLGDVLSRPISQDTVSKFNTWVNDFGTSPFLGLLDPEHALQGFRQQANINLERENKRKQRPSSSADRQMLDYFQSLGMTPDQAYNELLNFKRESKSPLVQVGGEGETTFQKEMGKAFANELSEARTSYDTRMQLTPNINSLRSYLEKNPNVSWGSLLSGTLEDFKQWFGLADRDAQVARQAMKNIGSLLRAENVKKVTGGGQVSNKEQEYVTAMIPGEDKTAAQNLYILQNWDEINRRFNARLDEANRMLARGATYFQVQARWNEMQKEDADYFDGLYSEYQSLGERSTPKKEKSSGGYRVIRRID